MPLISDRAVQRILRDLFASFAEDLRRQRLDAGLSIRALAIAGGVDPSHLARIELGVARPSPETMARLSLALGSDLVARMYPNTGPLVRDHFQAPIASALLASVHPTWDRYAELAVRRPSRGWIDNAFHHREQGVLVATEIQSDLRRIEQLIRWSEAKAESLPSWDLWTAFARPPAVSRLLVVRATRAAESTAEQFRRLLRLSFPADPDDALASLARAEAWPGPAMLWAVRARSAETYRIVARP